MPSHDSKTGARAELVGLIESELNTWKRNFRLRHRGRTLRYEDSRDRICQLYAELIDREAAA